MLRPFFILFTSLILCVSGQAQTKMSDSIPFNQLQWLATHNSYHIAPPPPLRELINAFSKGGGDALNYTFPPLTMQLNGGIRGLELDLYNDPQGGVYAQPFARKFATAAQIDEEILRKPGLKILHSPDFDVLNNVATLRLALRELRAWSDVNPGHSPILVQLELKTESYSAVSPPDFDAAALRELEDEIREEMPLAKILTPDQVRGDYPTLRDAVTSRGWPALGKSRGKFLFALDNEDKLRDRYLALSPQSDLRNRLCFVSVAPTHAAAAWMKRNDPIASFDEIRALVQAGFVVRTRADENLREIARGDSDRFIKAVQSGAQWISTDTPETYPRDSFPAF